MSIDKKNIQEKIQKYTDTKFPHTLLGYEPTEVDLLFDDILIDYQYLASYSLELEKLNFLLKQQNIDLKNKLKELNNINEYLKNRVSLKRKKELDDEEI